MAKQPGEMDAREQAVAALELAETFGDPFEFNQVAVPLFSKLGAADVVQIFRDAHGLDVKSDLQPHETVNTVNATADPLKGGAGEVIPQAGINRE